MTRLMLWNGTAWASQGGGVVVPPDPVMLPSQWGRKSATVPPFGSQAFDARPADIPAPIVGRPSGPGYIRYEDLYQTGDTVTQAMERMGASGIITFPEGVFEGVGFPQAQGYASILIPKRCDGIIGSGKGTLGGTTGTVFTIAPNSSTYKPPNQGSSLGSQARVLMRIDALRGGTFANFQIAGTEQKDGARITPFHGFSDYKPAGRSTFQDLLITGWYGDNGAPPGETGAVTVSGKPGSPTYHGHRFVRVETDARRTVGGPSFGQIGIFILNTIGGYAVDCVMKHQKDNGLVFFQTFDFRTHDMVIDQRGVPAGQLWAPRCMNQERTAGNVHFRPSFFRSSVSSNVHMSHSNDSWATNNYDGKGHRSVKDGSLTVVDPTYTLITGYDPMLYIISWSDYHIGGMEVGGDSMVTPPRVIKGDGVTPIPFKWAR